MRSLWLLVCLASLNVCFGAKILVLVPTPGRSHAICFDRLVNELGKRGHEVTYVSCFERKKVANVTDILVPLKLEDLMGRANGDSDLFAMKDTSIFLLPIMTAGMGSGITDAFLKSAEVQTLLKSDKKFDLIINEAFLSEALTAGFSYKHKAPIIGFSTGMTTMWSDYMVGNPSLPSLFPNGFLAYNNQMSVIERTKNILLSLYTEVMHSLHHLPKQDALMKKYFGHDLPPLRDIILNTSLVLVNYNDVFAFPRPSLPNVINVGGLHIPPVKPLPQDLKDFLDNSKAGVILFSMGSNLKSSMMSPHKIQMFLNAFSKLKQDVLWKFETDNLPQKPKNVKISSWLPQSDILAHPNLKLFITHGGHLSTTEAVLRGVPVIGIPIFGDQPANMKQAESAGYGIKLDFNTLTSDTLLDTINEVIVNPRYREVVKRKSAIFQDSPLSPLDTAIFWIEYVLRHDGAPHMRSMIQDLTWYQYYLLDVAALVVTATILALWVTKCTIKFIVRKLFAKNKKNVSSKKKRN